jgi:beta-mannanase
MVMLTRSCCIPLRGQERETKGSSNASRSGSRTDTQTRAHTWTHTRTHARMQVRLSERILSFKSKSSRYGDNQIVTLIYKKCYCWKPTTTYYTSTTNTKFTEETTDIKEINDNQQQQRFIHCCTTPDWAPT